MNHIRNAGAVMLSFLFAACAATPDVPDTLIAARTEVARLDSEPRADDFEQEVLEARSELETAERLAQEGASTEIVAHHAYLARQLSALVLAQADGARAEEQIADADERRQALLLRMREQELAQAELAARRHATEAELANARADRQALVADSARMTAQQAQLRARELQQELSDLKAQETERGLVLTLTDVLFDTNDSKLKRGSNQSLDKIAAFLLRHSSPSIIIEGHTDARGAPEYNEALSQLRADAVRNALIERGVPAERISSEGKGESFPVASNDSSAGRQKNRRVEIVVTS